MNESETKKYALSRYNIIILSILTIWGMLCLCIAIKDSPNILFPVIWFAFGASVAAIFIQESD